MHPYHIALTLILEELVPMNKMGDVSRESILKIQDILHEIHKLGREYSNKTKKKIQTH